MVSAEDAGGGGGKDEPQEDAALPAVAFRRVVPQQEGETVNSSKIGGESNILVAVRCRPMNAREVACGHDSIVKVMDKMVIVKDPPAKENDFLREKRTNEKRYAFDHAFNKDATQADIHAVTTKLLIDGVMNGFNATVFAYGATGTGKTYTMIGTPTSPGLMVLTVEEFFTKVRLASDKKFRVTLSYLEVYNELIHDLLRGGGSNPEAAKLELREDVAEGVKVAGLSAIEANSTEEVMELLRKGNQHRTMEPTHANAVSSRSHAVLQITCEQRDRTNDTHQSIKVGKLSLIDLAGSERAAVTNNVGARMLEGANINRSLLALGNCINALAGSASTRRGYIPYRDSKLTRLLKDSLGGNCRTVMICTSSPSPLYYEETLNTLKYANRAKNIKTTSTRVVNEVDQHIAQYVNIISDLRSEIAQLKSTARAPAPPSAREVENSRAEVDDQRDRQERNEMEKLRSAIQGNFLEKKEVKSQLIELNDLNLNNKIQVSKKQLEVHRWEKENMNTDKPVPSWVAAARNDIKTAKANVAKNTRLQRELEARERDLVDECQMLREQVRRVPLIEERRLLLEQDFQLKELEIEKMQMRQLAKTHANQIQDRDLRVRKLVQQVEASNDVIRRQKNILEEHDIHTDELLDVPIPFSPTGEAGRGDPMRLSSKRRASDARSDRTNSRFPEIRTSGTGHSARRGARSREGLLGSMNRLRTASRERAERAASGERSGRDGDVGPPVLVTVTPRREREREIERRGRVGQYGQGGASPERTRHGRAVGGAGRGRPPSIDNTVRSNDLEYRGGVGTGGYGEKQYGRRTASERGGQGTGTKGYNPRRTPRAPRDRRIERSYRQQPREGFGAGGGGYERKGGAGGYRGPRGQYNTASRRPGDSNRRPPSGYSHSSYS